MSHMADGNFRLVSGGRRPFGSGVNGQQILKFEFDDHLIFMFGFQLQRNLKTCLSLLSQNSLILNIFLNFKDLFNIIIDLEAEKSWPFRPASNGRRPPETGSHFKLLQRYMSCAPS